MPRRGHQSLANLHASARLAGSWAGDVVLHPWSSLIANPDLWHLGFHRLADLPETLITGHLEDYFGFFYIALSGGEDRVSAELKAAHVVAHSRLPEDAEDNVADTGRRTVPLYICGSKEPIDSQTYVAGFRKVGRGERRCRRDCRCGHFVLEEKPIELADVLSRHFSN